MIAVIKIMKNVVVSLRLMRGNVLQSRPLGGIRRQIRRNPRTNISGGGGAQDKQHKLCQFIKAKLDPHDSQMQSKASLRYEFIPHRRVITEFLH